MLLDFRSFATLHRSFHTPSLPLPLSLSFPLSLSLSVSLSLSLSLSLPLSLFLPLSPYFSVLLVFIIICDCISMITNHKSPLAKLLYYK